MIREIVRIDEDLCDGCGDCVPNCHEGALQIIDGKARLINEARVNTIQMVMMEVPCCGGLLTLVKTAMSYATRNVPVKVTVISTRGEVLSEAWN